MIDMPRDLYVPLALFIVGLAIYVPITPFTISCQARAIAGVIFGVFIMTMFKAALLIGLRW